ncbi:MAG TPA: glycoside hydrolase family 127 protein, partial [Bacteroidales bacterium]|nr:glycoside hydrolase family 127 protein [Bacteroidales bacterium]
MRWNAHILISVFLFSNSAFLLNLFSQAYRKAEMFPNSSVTLTSSWVKQREDLNTQYLKSLDPDRLLHNFRINTGLPSEATPLEGWEAPKTGLRGHFTGHYLSAVSSLVEKYKDPVLSQRLGYIIDELYKCQKELGKGYLSAFPERDFDWENEEFKNNPNESID